MSSDQQFRFVREILYSLKKDYGSKADFYHITDIEQDPETGRKLLTKSLYKIRRVILLPTILSRKISIEMGFKTAGAGMTTPGYDSKERLIIVDSHDLPKGMEVQPQDYFIIDGRRHDMKTIEELENNQALLLTTKILETGNLEEIIVREVSQTLSFNETITLS